MLSSQSVRYAALAAMLLLSAAALADPPGEPVSDQSLAMWPESTELLKLRGRLAYGGDLVTDEGIKALLRLHRLRVLHADGLGLTDQALEAIGQLSTLEELSLDSNSIDGNGLHHLAKLPKLRRLSLNFNSLEANDFAVLGDLSQLTHLSVLGSYVVDDGVFRHCARLTQLERLQLPEKTGHVSDQGLAHLTGV